MSILTVIALIALGTRPALAGTGGLAPAGSPTGSIPVQQSAVSGVSAAYAKFTVILSRRTGLSARVVAAWALAEGGPKDNPLNIGPGEHYGTVRAGARATDENLRTELYRNIMDSVGEADSAQIDAIVSSPWCPGCKGYRRLLRSTYRGVQVNAQ